MGRDWIKALLRLSRERNNETQLKYHDTNQDDSIEVCSFLPLRRQYCGRQEQEAAQDEADNMDPGSTIGETLEVVSVCPIVYRTRDAASWSSTVGDQRIFRAVTARIVW